MNAPRGRVEGQGVQLAYLEWAGGGHDVLVLLHGITGQALDWEPTVRHLLADPHSRFSRIVAIDARGHGGSGWDSGEAYAGDAHFADVIQALAGLEIESCVLAGFSMGGGVAMMAAAAAPRLCHALAVIDAYPDPEMTSGSLSIARALAAWWERRERDGRAEPPWPGAPFDPAIARSFARDLAAGDPRRLDLWPFWDALECPVALVRGEFSPVLPRALAGRMLMRQPRARLMTIPGAGHALPLTNPAEIAEVLASLARE